MPIYQWERDRSNETLIFDYHVRLGLGAEPSEAQAVIDLIVTDIVSN
jgi:hypothetical protein